MSRRIYYHDSSASLILGDSRWLPEIPDGFAAMCLTSPPYFAKRNYGDGDRIQANHKAVWRLRKGGTKMNDAEIGLGQSHEEYLADMRSVFAEVYRILRENGTFVLNVAGRRTKKGYTFDDVILAQEAQQAGLTLWDQAIFVRGNPQPTPSTRWLDTAWESLFIFAKGEVTVRKEINRSNVIHGFSGCFGGNVHSDGSHGAVMPSAISDWAIRSFSDPGEVVLDPFLGWGTTAYRALRFGRRAIGAELYEKSLLKVKRRLQGQALDEGQAFSAVGQMALW